MKMVIARVHGFVDSNLVKTLSKNNTIYDIDIIASIKDGVKKQ